MKKAKPMSDDGGVFKLEVSFECKLSSEDQVRLMKLAKHYNLSVAQVVRMLVKRDHDWHYK